MVSNQVSPPNKKRLLSEIAYEKIKEAIIVTELSPGQEVSESKLLELFDIGKAALRHALVTLTKEGLMEPINRRGYIIAPLTLKDIQEMWALRLLLETEGVRLAAGKVDEKYLHSLNQNCKKGFNPGDINSQKKYLNANQEFHIAICRFSGNLRLAKIVEQMIEQLSRILYLGIVISENANEWELDHNDLLKALVKGDGEEATKIMRNHLIATRDSTLKAIIKSPVLLNINLADTPSI